MYDPFSYETLADMQQQLQPHNFIWGWDLKEGYHAMRLAVLALVRRGVAEPWSG